MVDKSQPFDKRCVRQSFTRAADTYDEAAVLQHEVGRRMLERLEYIRLQPARIIDVGCGTGRTAQGLKARYRKAGLLAVDLAEPMLQRTRSRFSWLRRPSVVCADADALPLPDASCDLVFSSLTVQWCPDIAATLAEFRRVLRPGGLLMFSTFGPDTLKELRASWAEVDGAAHVNRFVDMHDIGDAALRSGLAEPVMDAERIVVTYDEARGLMRDLKAIGAEHVPGRSKALTGKQRLQAMTEAYEQFRQQGRLPATYEVIYGHAWCPEARPAGVSVAMPELGGKP